VNVVVVDASLLDAAGGRALEEWLLGQPGAGLLVTSTGPMPVLPPGCQGRLRGLISKPYSAEVLLAAVRRPAGGRGGA
jgi:hypothetical protein